MFSYREFFPNVIGAIDRCHIEVELTEEKVDEFCYTNDHMYHSMVLLVRNEFISQLIY